MTWTDPVGPGDIANRLGVQVNTVHVWRRRGVLPDPRATVGGVPLWDWGDVEAWAIRTGRRSPAPGLEPYRISFEIMDRLQELAHLLAESRLQWRRLAGDPSLVDPIAGSPASAECKVIEKTEEGPGGPWPSDECIRPRFVASLFGLAAAEHIGGLAALFSAGEVIFPVAPVVRAIVEHSSRAMWLLDPAVLPRNRAARAWLEELEGARQARQTAARLGGRGSHHAADAYVALRLHLDGLFTPDEIRESKSSVTSLSGETRPTAADALERASVIAGNVRTLGTLDYLANASHPTTWAIRDLLTEDRDESGVRRLVPGLDDTTYLERLAGAAAISLFNVARCLAGYLGWPDEVLDGWFETINAVLPENAPWDRGRAT